MYIVQQHLNIYSEICFGKITWSWRCPWISECHYWLYTLGCIVSKKKRQHTFFQYFTLVQSAGQAGNIYSYPKCAIEYPISDMFHFPELYIHALNIPVAILHRFCVNHSVVDISTDREFSLFHLYYDYKYDTAHHFKVRETLARGLPALNIPLDTFNLSYFSFNVSPDNEH